jgi:hypothetical protein
MSLIGSAQAATAGRDYGESVKALQQEKWEKAEEAIRSALEKEGSAQESMLISGGVRYRYLPYYVLGAALYGQGDCAGATEAWKESLKQGQVQNTKSEYTALQAGMSKCGAMLAESAVETAAPAEPVVESVAEEQVAPEPTPKPAPQPAVNAAFTRLADANANSLEELRLANSRYEQLARNTDLAPEWPGDWKPALDKSRRELSRLEGELQNENRQASATSDTAVLETISSQARAALDEINTRLVAAEQRIDVLSQQRIAENSAREEERKRLALLEEQRRQTALREQQEAEQRRLAQEQREKIEVARKDLQQELNRVAPVLGETGGDARVEQARNRLAALVDSGEALTGSNSLEELGNQSRALRDGLRSYSQTFQEWEAQQREVALRTPPDELKRIADAYFSGDYEMVSRLSDPANFEDTRQRVQAYLFRSAAQFNKYWLTGGDDKDLLERSRRDIAEIKRLDGDFVPYVAAFSPRYMDFFRDS